MSFKIGCHYNGNLKLVSGTLDTLVSLELQDSDQSKEDAVPFQRVYGFVVDVSGSMMDNSKHVYAKSAIRNALEMLPKGSKFFIIIFSSTAKVLMPITVATNDSISKACETIQRTSFAQGGTCFSEAIVLLKKTVKNLLSSSEFCYVQFITDGHNESGDNDKLSLELAGAVDMFKMDCWGIGADWSSAQLLEMVKPFNGFADAILSIEGGVKQLKEAAQRLSVIAFKDVILRLKVPRSVKITKIEQQQPILVDLSNYANRIDDRTVEINTGEWCFGGTKDLLIQAQFEKQPESEEMMIFRPSVVYNTNDGQMEDQGPRVVVTWTADEFKNNATDSQLEHYAQQQEMSKCIQEGILARQKGDDVEATVLLGKAYKLAVKTNNVEMTVRLKGVVDVIDETNATVRLKPLDKLSQLNLEVGSTRTIRKSIV